MIRTVIKIKQSRWRVMEESVWEQSRVVMKHISSETEQSSGKVRDHTMQVFGARAFQADG